MSNDPFISTRIPHQTWNAWEVKHLPETPEECMHVLRALITCGLTFHADDPKVATKLDNNPMLERT